jgi:hypothetical protein
MAKEKAETALEVVAVEEVPTEYIETLDENGIVEEIKHRIHSGSRALVAMYWNIGKLVTKYMEPYNYGEKNEKMTGMAEKVGVGESHLYACMNLYEWKSNFQEAIDSNIGWSHLRLLVERVKDPQKRDKLLEDAKHESMSVRDLRDHIKKELQADDDDKQKSPPKTGPAPEKDPMCNPVEYFKRLRIFLDETSCKANQEYAALAEMMEKSDDISDEAFEACMQDIMKIWRICGTITPVLRGFQENLEEYEEVREAYAGGLQRETEVSPGDSEEEA